MPCDCWTCTKEMADANPLPESDMLLGVIDPRLSRYFLCETCGNKRCPHATDHRLACTGSNASGQPGSLYENVPRAAPETPEPAVLAPEGTEDGRSNSPGIDPEKAALRERVRGLEEALRELLATVFAMYDEYQRDEQCDDTKINAYIELAASQARALLPLPEGGFGLSVSVAESGISPAAPARTETPGQAGKGAA